MDAKEMRQKTDGDLQDELLDLRKEQFNLRMQRAIGQLGNPARFKEIRREIARLKTILNERSRTAT